MAATNDNSDCCVNYVYTPVLQKVAKKQTTGYSATSASETLIYWRYISYIIIIIIISSSSSSSSSSSISLLLLLLLL